MSDQNTPGVDLNHDRPPGHELSSDEEGSINQDDRRDHQFECRSCGYVYEPDKGIKKLEAKTNQRFDECFLIASEEAQLFNSSVDSSKAITVLGNGLDFDAFYPAKTQPCAATISTGPHFLFTGVMDYKPNVDAVLWFVKNWSN